MIDRPSLTADGLDEVWDRVRLRLEGRGTDNRGRVRLPPLSSRARLTLGALLGRPPGQTVDLAALERSLLVLGLGPDLPGALAGLGHPVSPEPGLRRADRAAGGAGRDAARTEAGAWPEPWASTWIDEVIRAGVLRGLDADGATRFVRSVRTVLDRLDAPAPDPTAPATIDASGDPAALLQPGESHARADTATPAPSPVTNGSATQRVRGASAGPGTSAAPMGRVDLAAQLLGSSHALDTGTRLEAAITRALVRRLGPADSRDLWEQAGAHLDLTSGPVLTWRLPLDPTCRLAALTGQATALAIPFHLTQFALRRHPVRFRAGTVIVVVENPRIVEAAAQSDAAISVVATNGNPSGAVRLLLGQLLEGGATLRYHGDFDAAGLAMCARMADAGLLPWRMDADDYLAALASAAAEGVDLPVDPAPAGPTPWDPRLQHEFDHGRRIVHEERLLPGLLTE